MVRFRLDRHGPQRRWDLLPLRSPVWLQRSTELPVRELPDWVAVLQESFEKLLQRCWLNKLLELAGWRLQCQHHWCLTASQVQVSGRRPVEFPVGQASQLLRHTEEHLKAEQKEVGPTELTHGESSLAVPQWWQYVEAGREPEQRSEPDELPSLQVGVLPQRFPQGEEQLSLLPVAPTQHPLRALDCSALWPDQLLRRLPPEVTEGGQSSSDETDWSCSLQAEHTSRTLWVA